MTTNDNTPTTPNPPDWAAADRLRPIEELLQASSGEACFTFVIEAVRGADPAAVPMVEILIEAVTSTSTIRDGRADGYYFHRSAEVSLPDPELRAALLLGLAITGMPGAAAETSQAYAALAVDLSRWLASSAWQASTDDEKAVVRRVEQRVRIARLLSTGWAAIAAGLKSDYHTAATTTHAAALGAEVEAAVAPRAVLPDPESREEEATIDEGWRRRIDALYGKFGYGLISARGGWATLIEDALEGIDDTLKPEEREAFHVSDLKEKYGTLRIYVSNSPDAVDPIIEVAERRSALTCDVCGDHGRVFEDRHWYQCRCARHSDK
jgi:hypothetical protein